MRLSFAATLLVLGVACAKGPHPASRLAIMPATAHTAVITQPDLLYAFIEPFLKGVTPKGMFGQ